MAVKALGGRRPLGRCPKIKAGGNVPTFLGREPTDGRLPNRVCVVDQIGATAGPRSDRDARRKIDRADGLSIDGF